MGKDLLKKLYFMKIVHKTADQPRVHGDKDYQVYPAHKRKDLTPSYANFHAGLALST